MSRAKAPSVDVDKVERLADLARLSLTPGEAERMGADISSILDYFAALDRVDTSGVRTFETAQHGGQRDDVVRPSTPEEVLRGVPQKKGRYVRAPRVF